MSATICRIRAEPDQRLDLSALTPALLRDHSEIEVASLPIGTTRLPVTLGEVFDISLADRDRIRIVGGSKRLDGIGSGLVSGEIRVEGDVGQKAGLGMRGGQLVIEGSAGPLAGAQMRGGKLLIEGDTGDFAGGAEPGAMTGMRGGMLLIRGSAGERLGDRMRRGVIAVSGRAGPYAGSRLRGGTILAKRVGNLPGYLMRRGSLIVEEHGALLPTFLSSGLLELQFLDLLRSFLADQDVDASRLVPDRIERLQGDTATLGRGEILVARP